MIGGRGRKASIALNFGTNTNILCRLGRKIKGGPSFNLGSKICVLVRGNKCRPVD